ncbi:MAG: copper amine oxidase N-terminal domain-containing protein, partial [Clostridiales bacterium]|nr:copper amine oxidase N-terminal domain-containing protein [Clostridiales bacterium]
MKKRKAFKSFILGFLFAAILFGTVVMANPALREIVYGVRVSFNGVPVVFDAGMEPFIMEGRTFLPVRTVAEMVGLHVDFIDGIVYLTPEGGTRPSVAATPAPVRGENDLGGMVINIGNWWSDECTETFSPSLNSYSEATIARWNDRRVQEQLYNFRIREVRYGSWHDVRDDV